MENLFKHYTTDRADMITVEGVEKLSQDLGVDVMDVVWIPLSYMLGSKRMCELPKKEFLHGCKALKINSMSDFSKMVPNIRNKLTDPVFFKEVYLYTFLFGKEENLRSMKLETAIAFWDLLFKYVTPEQQKRHADFIEFISSHMEKPVKVISKDTWNLYLDFLRLPDLSTFDLETSSWPLLIDQFVEWHQSKK